MTQTHKINEQTPGPLFLGRQDCIQTSAPPCNGRILADMTHSDQRDLKTEARLFCAGYTMLDKVGRALGVDAAELGENLDLVALLQMLAVGRNNADARADMGPLDVYMVRLLAKLPKPV